MTAEVATDKRIQHTRNALRGAFFGLVLERHYEQIRIADVIERAGVGRSTFYEHFRSKDALLESSLVGPFSVLAAALGPLPSADVERLQWVLEHFWQNRTLARGILSGGLRARVVRVLAGLIEQRLADLGIRRADALLLPRRLAAIQFAESLLGPITAWVHGEVACEPAVLASALQATSHALLASLRRDALPLRRDGAGAIPGAATGSENASRVT